MQREGADAEEGRLLDRCLRLFWFAHRVATIVPGANALLLLARPVNVIGAALRRKGWPEDAVILWFTTRGVALRGGTPRAVDWDAILTSERRLETLETALFDAARAVMGGLPIGVDVYAVGCEPLYARYGAHTGHRLWIWSPHDDAMHAYLGTQDALDAEPRICAGHTFLGTLECRQDGTRIVAAHDSTATLWSDPVEANVVPRLRSTTPVPDDEGCLLQLLADGVHQPPYR